MDSGNSGSLQSSSGGDEEYDSRTAADHSVFMNTHPPPPPPSLFDPFSNYTQQLHHQNPNNNNFNNNNPNPGWPGSAPLRPDLNPNHSNIANPFMPSFQQQQQQPPPAPAPDAANPGGSTAARNPRKRSRASRRAPTTVLTTDTTNFRAMVQEFTGIPAPPFSNPSFPIRSSSSRLDSLFGSRSAMDAVTPEFLRRPFAQRGQTPSFLVANNNIMSSNNYPPPPQLPFSNNLLNSINNNNSQNQNQNQNPLFGSLLQTNPSKLIFSNSSVMASKPHNQGSYEIPSSDMKIGPSLDDFGLGGGGGGHGNTTTTLNDLPSLISSDQARARNDRRDEERDGENAAKWRRNNNNNNNNNNDDGEGDGYNNNNQAQQQLKPGGFDFSGSTSTSFQGEKGPGPENVATTTTRAGAGDQGMVESWIYSSE